MITEEMYRMMRDRRFGDNSLTRKHATKVNGAIVRRIHELVEQGWKDKEIADLLGVTPCNVNYRRQKMLGLR